MSIDLSTKEFGFELYQLKAELNAFSRKKIYKKDENGVDWFRYTKDHHDISYQKYTYVGRREVRSYGEVEDDIDDFSNNYTEYFLKNDGDYMETYDNRNLYYFDVPEWYETEAEVIEQVEKLKLVCKGIDRK